MSKFSLALLPAEQQFSREDHDVISTLYQRTSTGEWPVEDDVIHMDLLNKGHEDSMFACVVEIYGPKMKTVFVIWSDLNQSPNEFVNRCVASEIEKRFINV